MLKMNTSTQLLKMVDLTRLRKRQFAIRNSFSWNDFLHEMYCKHNEFLDSTIFYLKKDSEYVE